MKLNRLTDFEERIRSLFGGDEQVYQVVLREGNDLTHTYFTGSHVDCLLRMREMFSREPELFESEDWGVDLLNISTGRLMSWTLR